jgi:hypothetical protein
MGGVAMGTHRERLKLAVSLLIDVLFDMFEAKGHNVGGVAPKKKATGMRKVRKVRTRGTVGIEPRVEDPIEVDDLNRERARRALLRRGKLV